MRAPAALCSTRVTPASTFKIPHALAALDAGVLSGLDAPMVYDGAPAPFETWRRDQTLQSAMWYSVVWYFQRVARLLGEAREQQYLARLEYGNQDRSSGLESFWLGGSLLISPDEQERFLARLDSDALPVAKAAMQGVRSVLVQPPGVVVNATGEHPFSMPWSEGAVLSAKTGSSDDEVAPCAGSWDRSSASPARGCSSAASWASGSTPLPPSSSLRIRSVARPPRFDGEQSLCPRQESNLLPRL